jgi:hypothetical protein
MGTVAHEISEVLGRCTLYGSSINGTRAYSVLDLKSRPKGGGFA